MVFWTMKQSKVVVALIVLTVLTSVFIIGEKPLVAFNVLKDPAVQFKWVDDDGSIWTNADDDGVIPYVPPIEQVPLDIQFQIIKDEHTYFGQENQQQAMENISLSGNALFIGTLDKIPEVTFINGKTWNVPIVPTMALNGGEITFTVTAWNITLTEKLSIGGDNLNGTIVTVSPTELTFGENVTLTVTVKGATGYPFPNAEVYVCYIGDVDGGIPGDPIESHMLDHINGGGNTNGEYTLIFNTSQQTVNQTLAGFTDVKARRNISVYVKLYRGGTPTYIYGYAKFEMKPGLSELQIEINGGISTTVVITNVGSAGVYDVEWHVRIRGGFLRRINLSYNGTFDILLSGWYIFEEMPVIIGLGQLEITATAGAANAEVASETKKGFILLFLVILLS